MTTNAKSETFTSITDKRGNVRKVLYGTALQVSSNYTDDNKISSITDAVSGTFNYTYNQVDQLTKVVTGSQEIETYSYDNYGNLSQKSVKSNDGQGNTVNHVYTYRYKNDLTGELKGLEIGTSNTVRYENDVNGRLKEKTICTGVDGTSAEAPALMSENYYYRKVGDHATNQISTIRYGARKGETLILRDSVRYAYDGMGNITKVYENGEQTVSYEYDGIGRLKRENNRILGKTKVYAYDGNGNILTRREYVYTVKGEEELPEDYDEYTYGYEKGTDKLLEVESRTKNAAGEYEEKTESFAYDDIGNPTSYKGKTLTWTKGRRLTSYDGIEFGYNGQGQRISRKQGSTNNFTYDMSGNLIKESRGTEYFYDSTGVCGMKYGEEMYFYRKDVFGNITEILDSSGAVVVRYRYDAWGNHVVLNPNGSENESSTFIGNINPFRYRGYYYDTTLKLYYLKTRYYDPKIGRFITIDDISYLAPDTINGLNLYAYCGNNPVMNVDPEGTFVISLITGLIVSFVIGFGVSTVSQGFQYGWKNINWGQSIVDGLFTVVSTALAATGIGSLASIAIGAVLGFGQYAIDSAFHGESLTWRGALIAIGFGIISGAISGAGASSADVLAKNMSGRAESGVKALITTINRYGKNSTAYRNVMNLYGKAISESVQSVINREFTKSVLKIWRTTIAAPIVQYLGLKFLQLLEI